MIDLLDKYFLQPIYSRAGYNLINTFTYGVISILSLLLIRIKLKQSKIKLDINFAILLLFFIILGSSMRVITDAHDSGRLNLIFENSFLNDFLSNILKFILYDLSLYDYGPFTVSPFIYIKTAFLFLFTLFFIYKKNMKLALIFAAIISLFHVFALLFLFTLIDVFILTIFFSILISYFVKRFYFDKKNFNKFSILSVFGQTFDGISTFYAMDIFNKSKYCLEQGLCYGEQHVFSAFLGELFDTYFLFFLIKLLISIYIVKALHEEKLSEFDLVLILFVIFTIGLAPGLRNLLRIVCLT